MNLATYGYGYDLDSGTGMPTMLGQRTSLSASVPSQGFSSALTKYSYDPLYQLNTVTYPGAVPFTGEIDSWTYDAIGNRITNTVNGTPQTYSYVGQNGYPLNGQRLQGDGSNTYGYDANGNATSKTGPGGNLTFGYDWSNRMTSIGGATAATYTYDFQGRRTTKTVATDPMVSYLYDGQNLTSQSANTGTTYFLHGAGIDEPLAMYQGGNISYFDVDGLGSVVATNDLTGGTVTLSTVFDAWGNTKSETGTRSHPFTYTGREVGEAGQLFYRARYYQPSIGRFTQEDPVGFEGGMNRYAYALLSPARLRDPNGLKPEETATAAHVCCLKQKLGICWDQNVEDPTLKSCIAEHENDHIDYYNRHLPECPPPCEGKPDGFQGWQTDPPNYFKADLECQGYGAEYRCLKKNLSRSPHRDRLLSRINWIKSYAETTYRCATSLWER